MAWLLGISVQSKRHWYICLTNWEMVEEDKNCRAIRTPSLDMAPLYTKASLKPAPA